VYNRVNIAAETNYFKSITGVVLIRKIKVVSVNITTNNLDLFHRNIYVGRGKQLPGSPVFIKFGA
uniref:Uncharacterized protein n=1 Tax=Ciona intestinalis TaxID=7719 RepID=H2XQD6_CIOIN